VRVLQYAGAAVRGGLIDHVLMLSAGLAARGNRVTVALSPAPEIDEAARIAAQSGAEVTRLTVEGKSDLDGMLSLRKLVTAIDPDVVHLHLSSPVEAIPALASIRLGGARKMITTEHAPTHFPLARSWSHLSKRIASRWLHAVIALSESDAAFLREEFDIPGECIHVIPNGVTPDPELPEKGQARARLAAAGVPAAATADERGFWVGFAGALEEKKGVLDLLEGVRIAAIPDAVLVLAGRGSLSDSLAGRAARIPVALHLTGQLPDLAAGQLPDMAAFFAAVDVFVLPSHQEAMPLALLQAMAAGLPSIATRVGGIPEMIEDGVSGLLIAPKAPKEIAGALTRLAADPALRRRLGGRARSVVRERFAEDRMIDSIASLYAGPGRVGQEAV